jgi:hypothetical protein
MKIRTIKTLVLAIGLVCAAQAQAQQAAPSASAFPSVRWDLGIYFDGGGEKIATASYTNGDSQSIRMNEGATFSLGAAFPNDAAGQFETVVNAGYKIGGAVGENGGKNLSSMPLSLTQFFRPNDMRLGVGASYFVDPKYKVDIKGSNQNFTVNFDSPVGFHAQIGWAPKSEKYAIDLRYTSVKFQVKGFSDKVDGSSIGLGANVRF